MAKSFLVPWHPNDDWMFKDGYSSLLNRILKDETVNAAWEVGDLTIKRGDIIYLMILDSKPRGIVAKGIATSRSYSLNPEFPKVGVIGFTTAVDYTKGNYLNLDELILKCPNQNWSNLSTGIEIKEEYCPLLHDEWGKSLSGSCNTGSLLRENINHNLVIVKVETPRYSYNLAPSSLYEYTRSFWNCSEEYVKEAEYALSVLRDKVVEVYKIEEFIAAKDTNSWLCTYKPKFHSECISFKGKVADDDVRNYYLGRHVDTLYDYNKEYRIKLFLKNSTPIYHEGMYEPLRPKKRIRKADGTLRCICGYCGSPFSETTKCPECGQLVKL